MSFEDSTTIYKLLSVVPQKVYFILLSLQDFLFSREALIFLSDYTHSSPDVFFFVNEFGCLLFFLSFLDDYFAGLEFG